MIKQFNLKGCYFADPVVTVDDTGAQYSTSGDGWVAIETQEQIDAISASITGGGKVWLEGGQIKTTGRAPSEYHVWDDGQWVVSEARKQDVKTRRQNDVWEQIKAKREAQGLTGCYVASVGKWFNTDESSKQKYIVLRSLKKIPAETKWKTMDNSFVEMSKALLDEITLAIFAKEQADFANAERHRLQMLAVDDPLEYDFGDGWSDGYEQ